MILYACVLLLAGLPTSKAASTNMGMTYDGEYTHYDRMDTNTTTNTAQDCIDDPDILSGIWAESNSDMVAYKIIRNYSERKNQKRKIKRALSGVQRIAVNKIVPT